MTVLVMRNHVLGSLSTVYVSRVNNIYIYLIFLEL